MDLNSVLQAELDRTDLLAEGAAKVIARGRRSWTSRLISFLQSVVV